MPSADRMTHHPDTRLPQRVALGVLLRSFPPVQVDRVLDAAQRKEQRQRLLPARLMVYFTLGMWIFKALPYEQILTEILRDAPGLALPAAEQEPASAAAIGRARRRLGVEPLRLLFEQAAGPSAPRGPNDFHGLRPLRLGQVDVGVPATPANLLGFGVGGPVAPSPVAPAGRPVRIPVHARMSLLIEDGTRRIVAADVADPARPEPEALLADMIGEGDLLIMNERPLCARMWTTVERYGAQQLWPLQDVAQPSSATRLPDGSLVGKLPAEDGTELVVRVVNRIGGRPGRLATSLLDHRAASAVELAVLFEDQRRPGGAGFDGIGSYSGGDRLELRSKDPEMVRQELYAMLCVHHAIGDLIGPPR
jgi:hypothetical protein